MTWTRRIAMLGIVGGSIVGSLPIATPVVLATEIAVPAAGDCNTTPDATNCIATFSPSSPKAGEVVTVTTDPTGTGGIYGDFSTLRFTQGTSAVQVVLDTADGTNRSGTFVMPVLPAGGVWDVEVDSTGTLQGYGTITYGGAGDWVCATDFDQVVADNLRLCEQRFTASGSFTVPADVTAVEYLVVGGGGGGGGALDDVDAGAYGAGAGGGGGQVTVCPKTVTPNDTWTVTVGAGGAAGSTRLAAADSIVVANHGGDGGESSISRLAISCTAAGGYGGGASDGTLLVSALGPVTAVPGVGGASVSTPTNQDGGNGVAGADSTTTGGGGGGGQGDVGADATTGIGGDGGAGASTTGWFLDLADALGGGGGGGSTSGSGGAGSSGGGNGTTCSFDGNDYSCGGGNEAFMPDNAPTASTGGGGGGGAVNGAAASGAGGVVIVRYSAEPAPPVESSDSGVWIERGGSPVAPGDCTAFDTITAAVAAAQNADVIHICPGLYREGTITVALDDLTFVGEGESIADVRLDGGRKGNGDGNRVIDATGRSITLENLTVQNGYWTGDANHVGGAGVLANHVITNGVDFRGHLVGYSFSADAYGSAVSAVTASISNSTFLNNQGATRGGALYLSGAAPSTITDSTFFGNSLHPDYEVNGVTEEASGGAVFAIGALTVNGSQFVANYATTGGAINALGTLTITESDFDSNRAEAVGGGAINTEGVTTISHTMFVFNSASGVGSAIRASNTLTVTASSFFGHFEHTLGPVTALIYSEANNPAADDVVIENATFFNNDTSGTSVLSALGNVKMLYVTVVNNRSTAAPEVISAAAGLEIVNSLFAENVDTSTTLSATCVLAAAGVQPATSSSSVSDESTCGTVSVEPFSFGDFLNSGDSPTATLPLLSGNPAIDAADCAAGTTAGVTVDQNGADRPIGDGCDAGAFEFKGYDGETRFCPEDGTTITVGTDPQTGYPICQLAMTADGAFNPPSGVTSVDVVLVGGGGGGGAGGTDATGTAMMAGGGGAGGAVTLHPRIPVTLGTPVTVTVGAGGTGGFMGDQAGTTRGGDGGAGGTSSFGDLSVDGGAGGTGGGEAAGTYYVGVGGATPAGVGGTFENLAQSGAVGATVPAWDINHYYTSGGGGAGAGGAGAVGMYGPRVGLYADVIGGVGGRGVMPVDGKSLFANQTWGGSLNETPLPDFYGERLYVDRLGLAPGGGGGVTGIVNTDTYALVCGSGTGVRGWANDGSEGFGGSMEYNYYNTANDSGVITGVPSDMQQPDQPGSCGRSPAWTFGAGGGAGAGAGQFNGDASGGFSGVVVIRYLAGPLPLCGVDTGTATVTDLGGGITEMVITGKCTFATPAGVTSADIVAIGGGGGGGAGFLLAGGGGGGGEVALCAAVTLDATGLAITPGDAGGAGGPFSTASDGTSSTVLKAGTELCGAGGGRAGLNGGASSFPFFDVTPKEGGAAAGDGGDSGSGQFGGVGSISADDLQENFDSAAGGGGAGAAADGTSPVCPAFGVGGDCGSSAGGAGAVIGELTGANGSLFDGDTRAYGGGGGGGNSIATGTNDTFVAGGVGGGGNGGLSDALPTSGSAFGGGGGGYFLGLVPFCPFCEGGPANAPLDEPLPGTGSDGAVIIRYTDGSSTPGAVWIERNGEPVAAGDSCLTPPYTTITDAVAAAQADDVIHVCSGTYREPEIVVTVDNLTILGEAYVASDSTPKVDALDPPAIIDGTLDSVRHRIFNATGLSITFRNVVLRNGSADFGGAVTAHEVSIESSRVVGNDAIGGGAVFVTDVNDCSALVKWPPIIAACTLGSTLGLTAGIIAVNSEFVDNGVGSAIGGGALYANGGTVVVSGSTFDGNEALVLNDPALPSDGAGGAILADSVVVLGSHFLDNKATYHGGAISASLVLVEMNPEVDPAVASVFESNQALGDSAAHGYGGAIWADGVEVAHSSFTSNAADIGGAIASAASVGTTSIGFPTAATVTIESSTFSLNTATIDGGAVLNLAADSTTSVDNSTFVTNSAGNAGGAVYAQDDLSVSFSTFDANSAVIAGGVFWTPVAPSVDNNIFSYTAASDTEAAQNGCGTYTWSPAKDVGNLTTDGFAWCPGTLTSDADLDLQDLADNGGPTHTMALGLSSVALDAADATECNARVEPEDQRGVGRAVGDGCDIGAFEYYGTVTLDETAGVEHSVSVPSGIGTVYVTLVGGGAGGAAPQDGSAGGGGGGGEVVVCTITNLTSSSIVTYYFGLGGAADTDGERSWVKVDGTEACAAEGGQAYDSAVDSLGAGGASGGLNPNAGGLGAFSLTDPNWPTAGGGGGGAGGVGDDGSFDDLLAVSSGGDGGAGSAPYHPSFGDSPTLRGGGGGGGATYVCEEGLTAGAGGVGGGGQGATSAVCDGALVALSSNDGTDGLGGGGGGGAASTPGGSGGSGGGEARVARPTIELDQLHVCVDKLYVKYGADEYDPKVYYCVPEVDECPPVTDPTTMDPECCPTDLTAPTDHNKECETSTLPDPTEDDDDGYSVIDGDEIVDSGLIGELDEVDEVDEGEEIDQIEIASDDALIDPLDYEHGVPDGWRKVSPSEFPSTVPPTCSSGYVQGDGVAKSPMPITCEGGDPGEYEFNYEFVTEMYIHPVQLRVKPKHLHVAYGSPEPDPYLFTIKGFKLGETAAVLTDLPECDSDYDSSASAGSRFDITCSGGTAENYEFRYQSSHIHVDKRRVPLTPTSLTVTYGDPAPVYTYKVAESFGSESLLEVERLAGFVEPLCAASYAPGTPVGTFDVECSGAESMNFEFVAGKGRLTVTKATLQVAPRDSEVLYGTPSPTLEFDLQGFVNGETIPGSGYQAPKCAAPYYSPTLPAGSSVKVTCSGGSSKNYAFDVAAASDLRVVKAPLTVMPSNQVVRYGQAEVAYPVSLIGFKNGESVVTNPSGFTMPECTSAYSPTDAAGTAHRITCRGGSADNYALDTSGAAVLSVAKARLSVQPDAKIVTYGQPAPAYTASVTGFVNGESVASAAGYTAPVCGAAYSTTTPAGSVGITCTGGLASNYEFDLGTSRVTVLKAVLRATPRNASVVYSGSAPSVGVTVTGFVNGQTTSSASGYQAPKCAAVGYTSTSNAGTLPITCTGGSAANYVFDLTGTSTLTVTQATATLTATSQSVVYGSTLPVYRFTLSGLKNGQTAATVAGLVSPTCVSGYTPLSNAGTTSAITCSGASSTNYRFTYVAGKATVTKAPLTVTPVSITLTRGSAVPKYTATITGFQNGQTAATAASFVAPKCSSSYSTRSAVGNYTITCSSASALNYSFVYKTGVVTVR